MKPIDMALWLFSCDINFLFQGQFHEGSARGLGLVTFADGSHGQPPCEGYFEGSVCVKRKATEDAPKRARQAAAAARAILQQS